MHSVFLQSFMMAAPRPSLRGSGGLGPSSTCLPQCPALKALSVRTHTHTHLDKRYWPDLLTHWFVWVVTLVLCPLSRCGHQTLWCWERVAGARPLQLHLTTICGAQRRCKWRVMLKNMCNKVKNEWLFSFTALHVPQSTGVTRLTNSHLKWKSFIFTCHHVLAAFNKLLVHETSSIHIQ